MESSLLLIPFATRFGSAVCQKKGIPPAYLSQFCPWLFDLYAPTLFYHLFLSKCFLIFCARLYIYNTLSFPLNMPHNCAKTIWIWKSLEKLISCSARSLTKSEIAKIMLCVLLLLTNWNVCPICIEYSLIYIHIFLSLSWILTTHSYVGRACSASTATGSKAQHIREMNALLNDAIST